MAFAERMKRLPSCGGSRLAIVVLLGIVLAERAGAVINSNVQVNAGVVRSVMSPLGIGLHTSPYYNSTSDPLLPMLLNDTGVTTLRFGGGGYADVYHWSEHRLSPWWGDPNNFGYLGSDSHFSSFANLLDQLNGGQAVVTVNYGSAMKNAGNQSLVPDFGGQPKEAAAWVAYANADPSIYGTANDIVLGVDEQGNDWKTAGYWARLRASSPGEYATWAQADGVFNSRNNFLAVDRDVPLGVKYWEIGNETFGTGYYGGGTGYSADYSVPYDGTNRDDHPSLSPAHYGDKVVEFAQLMKQVDPTIKIGAVLATPPDDYSWSYADLNDSGSKQANEPYWNDEVLSHAASVTDFVMVHWYPQAGNNSNGDSLLSQVRTKLPLMINGTTAGIDTGSNAGIRDSLATYGISNAEIMVTEFNYFGTINPTLENAAESVFVADAYATWLGLGVSSVQYLEMLTKDYLTDTAGLNAGSAYFGIKMVDALASPGDSLVQTTSSHNNVRVHAARKPDGTFAVMIVNADRTNVANVNVNVNGLQLVPEPLDALGVEGGTLVRAPDVTFTGNQFSVSVPQRSVVTYLFARDGVPGDFDGDSDVDGEDFLAWQVGDSPTPLSQIDLSEWNSYYGGAPLSTSIQVPEPATGTSVLIAVSLMLLRRRVG